MTLVTMEGSASTLTGRTNVIARKDGEVRTAKQASVCSKSIHFHSSSENGFVRLICLQFLKPKAFLNEHFLDIIIT